MKFEWNPTKKSKSRQHLISQRKAIQQWIENQSHIRKYLWYNHRYWNRKKQLKKGH